MRNIQKDRFLLQGVEWPKEEKYPKRIVTLLAFLSILGLASAAVWLR